MDDVTGHPDDAELFDMVEGTLDPARAAIVDEHIARCAACGALVAAARSGRDATHDVAVELPGGRAEQLRYAVRAAWRERRARVLAGERLADGAVTPMGQPAGERTEVLEAIPTSGPPGTRRARRLLPIVAFAVLATLAGTSLYVDDERIAAPDRSATEEASAPGESSSGPGGDAAPAAPSVGGGPIEGDPSASTPPVAPGEPSDATTDLAAPPAAGSPEGREATSGGATDSTAGGAGVEAGSVAEMEGAAQALAEPICIATLDETALALPDGRIPLRIERGPLGIYVVCG